MDKRVYKTRKNLRQTLLKMMQEKPFAKITVKDICERANTSRITFYNHYGDKYELLDDVFEEIEQHLLQEFERLQKQKNANDDPVTSYQNLMDAILEIHDENRKIYQVSRNNGDMEVVLSYYHFLEHCIATIQNKYPGKLRMRYPRESMNAFLAMGMWAYFNSEEASKKPKETLRKETHALIVDLVNSNLFMRT